MDGNGVSTTAVRDKLRSRNISRLEKNIEEVEKEVTQLLLENRYCPHSDVVHLVGQKKTCGEVDRVVRRLVGDINNKSATLESCVEKLSQERNYLRGKIEAVEERLKQLQSTAE